MNRWFALEEQLSHVLGLWLVKASVSVEGLEVISRLWHGLLE